MYLNPKHLYYETIISQGLGRRTPRLEEMLILINEGVNRKFSYYDEDLRYECLMEGITQLLKNYRTFNPEKSNNVFAFFSEISKRGHAMGIKIATNRTRRHSANITILSMNINSGGGGFYNL